MATTTRNGLTITTAGELPRPGDRLPPFDLTGLDLGDVRSADLAGRRLILNIFPSVDTGVCALSVRRFNALAAGLPDTAVVCVSKDLPFALGRFCGAEGIEHVTVASAFRSSFGEDYGVTMVDGELRGLLARAVVIADATGRVVYTELVPVVGQEPDYDAAVAAATAATAA
jgi:thiol peroxidase